MAFERKYDREIIESEEGQRLYVYWQTKVSKNTDSPEFMTFPGFYNWAMENGYTVGAKLHRRDPKDPFNPDNCVWIAGEKDLTRFYPEFELKWNKTVNRIRVHYGMEPFQLAAETPATEVEDCG